MSPMQVAGSQVLEPSLLPSWMPMDRTLEWGVEPGPKPCPFDVGCDHSRQHLNHCNKHLPQLIFLFHFPQILKYPVYMSVSTHTYTNTQSHACIDTHTC